MHKIGNGKNYFIISLNLSGVDEKANIPLWGQWIKLFWDRCFNLMLKMKFVHEFEMVEYLSTPLLVLI